MGDFDTLKQHVKGKAFDAAAEVLDAGEFSPEQLSKLLRVAIWKDAPPSLVARLIVPGVDARALEDCFAIARDEPNAAGFYEVLIPHATPAALLRLLEEAALDGDLVHAKLAVDAGAEVDTFREGPSAAFDGYHPLISAVNGQNVEIVSMLLERGANPNFMTTKGRTLLELAEEKGDEAVVAVLRDAMADAAPPTLDLAAAALRGDLAAVETLAADAHEDERGQAAEDAAKRGHFEVVEHLLSLGISESKRGLVLLFAAGSGAVGVMRQLLEGGTSADEWRGDDVAAPHPALVHAAGEGQAAAVATLLEAGAAVDARNGEGETALFKAAAKGHIDLVETLLGAGADPSIPNAAGQLPRDAAQSSGSMRAVKKIRKLIDASSG